MQERRKEIPCNAAPDSSCNWAGLLKGAAQSCPVEANCCPVLNFCLPSRPAPQGHMTSKMNHKTHLGTNAINTTRQQNDEAAIRPQNPTSEMPLKLPHFNNKMQHTGNASYYEAQQRICRREEKRSTMEMLLLTLLATGLAC